MKSYFSHLAAIATVGAVLGFVPTASAQGNGGGAAAAPSQRICIVNIAKVLKDYEKANKQGEIINKKREAYGAQINKLKGEITELNKQFGMTMVPELKKKLQDQAIAIQRQIDDYERTAQTELAKLANETIVQVYKEVKGVINDIAVANNLAMVLCYPAATKVEDDDNPAVAQLMLQTPALIPFYHRGMDITEVVIKTLNSRAGSTGISPASGTGGTTGAPRQ